MEREELCRTTHCCSSRWPSCCICYKRYGNKLQYNCHLLCSIPNSIPISVNNKDGIAEGMVRVFNSVNNNRELIKGMSNEVLDLQFAHMKSIVLLGCIEQTALHVHKIEDTPEKVLCTLMVKIEDPIAGHVPLYDKIKWCPFVPEGEDEVDEYVGQQLVWFRGNVYQCYSIKTVVDAYGVCFAKK